MPVTRSHLLLFRPHAARNVLNAGVAIHNSSIFNFQFFNLFSLFSDGSVTFSYVADTETRYLSLATSGNDYYVFYANTNQFTHLLMLPKGQESATPIPSLDATPQAQKILIFNVIDAYIFLGKIFGLGERKLQKIVGQSNEYALSADDLMKLAVILQRISKKKKGPKKKN